MCLHLKSAKSIKGAGPRGAIGDMDRCKVHVVIMFSHTVLCSLWQFKMSSYLDMQRSACPHKEVPVLYQAPGDVYAVHDRGKPQTPP